MICYLQTLRMGPNAVAPCNMIQSVTKIESHTTCICFWQSYEYLWFDNGPLRYWFWVGASRSCSRSQKFDTICDSAKILSRPTKPQSKNTRHCRIKNPISHPIASIFSIIVFSMILCKTLVAKTISSMFYQGYSFTEFHWKSPAKVTVLYKI